MVAYTSGLQKVKRPPRKKKFHLAVPYFGGHLKEVKHTNLAKAKQNRAKMAAKLRHRGR